MDVLQEEYGKSVTAISDYEEEKTRLEARIAELKK
jgi:translation initiation factor 1 (eIF-1/SUI1)